MVTLGIVGTGYLGEAVAKRLINTNHKLTIHNRTKEKTDTLRRNGATIAQSPKEVAKVSDLVFTIVTDARATAEVSFGEAGIVEGGHANLAIADMSTISPMDSIALAKRFEEYNIPMLDTPVMGGPSLVEKGELVLMVGGKKDVYERYASVFAAIANKIFFLGKNGSGLIMKLAMNMQITMLALSISEAVTLVRGSGLNPHEFLEILNSTYFKTGLSLNKGSRMVNDQFEGTFALKHLRKDIAAVNSTAESYGLDLPMISLAYKLYTKAVDRGFGELDYTGILALIKEMNNK